MGNVRSGDILGPEGSDEQAEKVRAGFWKTMRRAARRIPFAEDVAAAYFCAFDGDTPLRVRVTLMGALAYFVLPIDAVPDFIAGIGFTDDAAVLMTAVTLLGAHLKPVHREAARRALAGDDPT
ncbi:YkvA family protein [Kaistia dalseonensis]|uniref:Uncharacterized membrane protein YkvA (DUF1232 family) n=1 Tax=Kaistia dalseonensis TaxID=410840 RepID=A0ABU0H5G7_9HYPH|nr:YkvA family protein [Kaistia dalseonensis]MCX5494696.1 YkvA family protein [Kaistia dalseonensis]MDQ0437277.1 uncharacterized membrane protein YkvA (DUF1232 family) [Kaistia dalseonensis]